MSDRQSERRHRELRFADITTTTDDDNDDGARTTTTKMTDTLTNTV